MGEEKEKQKFVAIMKKDSRLSYISGEILSCTKGQDSYTFTINEPDAPYSIDIPIREVTAVIIGYGSAIDKWVALVRN